MRALLALVLLGCGSGSPAAPDAPPVDTAPPPPPPRGTTQAFFLAFDGVSLTPGAADDATANVSVLVTQAVTVPPFRDGAADRATVIDATVAKLHELFDAYDTPVVTTRPASGTYTMIVFGGLASQVIGGNDAVLGLAGNDCGDKKPANIAFVFDASSSVTLATNSAAFDVGANIGMDGTSGPAGNCMCAAAGCSGVDLCSFSTHANVVSGCGSEQIQDQLAYLAGTLGTH